MDARRRLFRDWDHAQIDWEILHSDPLWDEAVEAAKLLDASPELAFQTLLGLAENGSIWAMIQVAYCYSSGRGVLADDALYEDWSRKAFERGSQYALLAYASIYWHRDQFDKCEEIYGVGAAADWAPAQYWLACAQFRRSPKRSTLRQVRPLLESAIAKGSPSATAFLSRYMIKGWLGLRNIPAGFRLTYGLHKEISPVLEAIDAAEKGTARAQFRLGWFYAFGGEVIHDDDKAMSLFNLAAAQGDANAMLAKGWMYAHGRAGPYDALEAYVWSAISAEKLPETDVESRAMAIEYRDFYRPLLSKADAAKARRRIKASAAAASK